MATLIRVDGTTSEVRPIDKKFTLEEMYRLIGCSTVELIRVPSRPFRQMWIDEDGRASGKQYNGAASALLAKLHGRTLGADDIVGDVLVTGAGEV
mgnify:CR=1 FL=1